MYAFEVKPNTVLHLKSFALDEAVTKTWYALRSLPFFPLFVKIISWIFKCQVNLQQNLNFTLAESGRTPVASYNGWWKSTSFIISVSRRRIYLTVYQLPFACHDTFSRCYSHYLCILSMLVRKLAATPIFFLALLDSMPLGHGLWLNGCSNVHKYVQTKSA